MSNESQLITAVEGVKIPKIIQGNRQKAEAYAAGFIYSRSHEKVDKVPESLKSYVPIAGIKLGSPEARQLPFYNQFEGGYLEAQAKRSRSFTGRSSRIGGRALKGDDDLVTMMHRAENGPTRYIPEGFLEEEQ